MPDARLTGLAERLLELTNGGRLRWQAPARPKDAAEDWQARAFTTRLPKGAVVIESDAPAGRHPYELRVHDPAGVQVGHMETGQDAERYFGDREADPWEATLGQLYAAARKSAVNADASLDAIIADLDAWGERKG